MEEADEKALLVVDASKGSACGNWGVESGANNNGSGRPSISPNRGRGGRGAIVTVEQLLKERR